MLYTRRVRADFVCLAIGFFLLGAGAACGAEADAWPAADGSSIDAPPDAGGASSPDAPLDAPPQDGSSDDAQTSDADARVQVDADADADADATCGALLCEDFESESFGALWSFEGSGEASASIVEAHGRRALELKVPGGFSFEGRSAFLVLRDPAIIESVDELLHVRARFYIEAPPAQGDDPLGAILHSVQVAAAGPVDGEDQRAEMSYGGQLGRGLAAWYASETECWQHSSRTMPSGRWACLEYEFDFVRGAMRMRIDGEAIEDLAIEGRGQACLDGDGARAWVPPLPDEIRVGWAHFFPSAPPDFSVWFDDIAVADAPIGCDL